MKRRSLFLIPPLALAILATDALAAQRVFVRSNGVDTGTCTLAAPCRGFAYAMTQVDAGGEVVALDAAGYGAVVIDKSVTVTTNPGFFAGISISAGSAITISGEAIHVILRGLNLNGLGGGTGVHVTSAASVTMENCVVSNFGGWGIQVDSNTDVRLTDLIVRGNGYAIEAGGIFVSNGSTATLTNVRMSRNTAAGLQVQDNGDVVTAAVVTDSDSSHNGIGFWAVRVNVGSPRISIRDSTAVGNALGAWASGGVASFIAVGNSSFVGNSTAFQNDSGTFESYSNNLLRYNTIDTSGTIAPATGQ